jgi:hypothetical protein
VSRCGVPNAEHPHKAACGTSDPIMSFSYRPDVRDISLPQIKPFGCCATFSPMSPFFRSSDLLNAACRVLAYVSSRLSRIGPSKMLDDCLVAILGMSFYTTKSTPQIMLLAFSIPITQARGRSRKRVYCIAYSSHFRF